MGTRKGDRTRGGTRSGDAGTATATLETHITQNAYTQWEEPSSGRRPSFRRCRPLSLLRGSFAAFFSPRRWTTPTFAFSFILKPNTDPVTRWVEAMEEYFFLPAALSRGV